MTLVRRGRRDAVLRAVGRHVLRGGGERRRSVAALPRGAGSARRSPPPDPVPRPVLGRPDHLQRRARAPSAADAAHAVHRRPAAARSLAACTWAPPWTQCAPTAEIAERLMAYFVPAAEQMRNDTGLPISSPGQRGAERRRARSRRSPLAAAALSESTPVGHGNPRRGGRWRRAPHPTGPTRSDPITHGHLRGDRDRADVDGVRRRSQGAHREPSSARLRRSAGRSVRSRARESRSPGPSRRAAIAATTGRRWWSRRSARPSRAPPRCG